MCVCVCVCVFCIACPSSCPLGNEPCHLHGDLPPQSMMVQVSQASPLNEVHRHEGRPATRLCPGSATNSFQNLRNEGNEKQKHLCKGPVVNTRPSGGKLIQFLPQNHTWSSFPTECIQCAWVIRQLESRRIRGQQGTWKHTAPPPPPNIPHVSLGICGPKTRHYTDEELFSVFPGARGVCAEVAPCRCGSALRLP